ncbi:hypothetical protein OPHB3_2475 [Oceanobacillus picturae]|uniref:Uncharacterized protein n=1 Tax=Oceanobacillus picturae TaxID=171693 RepID=A0A0U9HFH5_9BACI|nr:hypothetical protein [Oceanobacillus picturae]GAQ18534.1 hypothetical protein OPHB3_2475 [Oceanobacillus picturae]
MNRFLRFVSFSLVVALLITTINTTILSSKVAAATVTTTDNGDYTQEDVEELAGVLEILFEKGIIYDENGAEIGYDKEIIKEELSGTEYSSWIDEIEEEGLLFNSDNENYFTHNELKNNNNSPKLMAAGKSKRDAYLDKCITAKLSESFGPVAITAIVHSIRKKSFIKAAKQLLKMGIKSGGIAISLGWMLSSCIRSADKKGL